MKNLQKTIAAVALATLLFSSNLFAQSSGNDKADVKIQLKKGLSITSSQGIDFGEVVLSGIDATESILPSAGAKFQVAGHPGKTVVITYSDVTLINDLWAGPLSAPTGTLTFVSDMYETGNDVSYTGEVAVTKNGSAATALENTTGTGYLNLWVGGSIDIPAAQASGDYIGEMTVSVIY